MDHLQFNVLRQHSDCFHAIYTRRAGASAAPYDSLNVRFGIGDNEENVRENRRRIHEGEIISANQTHSKNCALISGDENYVKTEFGEIDNVDALITNKKNTLLMVQVADCQPILFFDRSKKVIAAVHAGWKGIASNIIAETINAMKENYNSDPGEIIACSGPSLGPCCSEFIDRETEFPKELHQFFTGNMHVDLWAMAQFQMVQAGIHSQNSEFSKICTKCNEERFFSYRKNKDTGRFGVVIMIK